MPENIQSDSNGFLLGTRRLADIAKGIDHLDDNTNEILALLKSTIEAFGNKQVDTLQLLLNQSKLANKQQTKLVEAIQRVNLTRTSPIRSTQRTVDVEPRQSSNTGRASTQGNNSPRSRRSTTEVNAEPRGSSSTRVRDSNGRFMGSGGSTSRTAETVNMTNSLRTAFGKALDVVASPKDVTGYDPSVDALHELSSILSPAAKGFRMMGRGASWLFKRRTKRDEILPEEQVQHNDQVERHNNEERKLLKRIISRLGGGSGSGGLSLPGGGGGLFGGILKGGGKGLGKLLKYGKGLPLIGTALSAMSLMDWDDKSTEEKGSSVGGIAGGVAGGAIGSVLGPLGTVVGAAVGNWAGQKLGVVVSPYVKNWTDSLKSADIPGRIVGAWTTFVDGMGSYFSEKFNNVVEVAKETTSKVEDKVSSIADFGASIADQALAKMGNKDAITRVKQRENGQIGYQSSVYQAQTSNNAPTPFQTVMDTAGVLAGHPTSNSLSGFIGKGEGGYNSVNLGKKHGYKSGNRNLTTMTVAQVKAMQDSKEVNAVGKFQIIRDTMPGVIKGMGLTGKEVFNEEMQERMGAYLLFNKRESLGDYLKGKHDNLNMAGDEGAREWASLPVLSERLQTGKYHSKRGSTAYSDGVNKASHSASSYENALRKARAAYADALKNGMSESDAQLVAFRGINNLGKNAKTGAQTKIPDTIRAPTTASSATTAQAAAIVSSSVNKMIAVAQPVQKVGAPAPKQIKLPNPKPPKVETIKQPVSTAQIASSRSPMDSVISQNISDRGLAHTATGGLGMSAFA